MAKLVHYLSIYPPNTYKMLLKCKLEMYKEYIPKVTIKIKNNCKDLSITIDNNKLPIIFYVNYLT